MQIDINLDIQSLKNNLDSFFKLATEKAHLVTSEFDDTKGSPVCTVDGRYTTRGWTEWTQGFQFGIPLLVYEVTGDSTMLELGKENTFKKMTPHISHFGVHDHGFNNLSTYGNLLRLSSLSKIESTDSEIEFYKLALKISGAVQAKRWTPIKDGGFIYSFNGPHSLFIDTIRTCRILLLSQALGHRMLDENDQEIDMFQRAFTHGLTSARYNIYYGEGRDRYDVYGRTAHESIFNTNDGMFRCPNSQQGYTGYSTWTRGLSWAMLGFSEFLEFIDSYAFEVSYSFDTVRQKFLKAAKATCDFYIDHTTADGIPFWDTGAPSLYKLGDYKNVISNPDNDWEPVDSSAAAIGAQGLLRLGKYLKKTDPSRSKKYYQAGLCILKTLLSAPYLSTHPKHQGILLHSIYHRPNGWDHIPQESKIPNGESSMWGDYHMTELCVLANQILNKSYYTFFDMLK